MHQPGVSCVRPLWHDGYLAGLVSPIAAGCSLAASAASGVALLAGRFRGEVSEDLSAKFPAAADFGQAAGVKETRRGAEKARISSSVGIYPYITYSPLKE